MNLIQYAFLCIILLLAGSIGAAWLGTTQRKKILQDLLAFTGAFLFGILVLELFPTIFNSHNHSIGLFVLLGFFLQIGMDILTRGVEHGHLHLHEAGNRNRMVVSMSLGLGLHGLFDGLPFLGFEQIKDAHFHSVYTGILLHKLAEGFTLFLVLDMLGMNLKKSFFIIGIFSLITPLGMLILQTFPILISQINYALAFAGGSLLHVAITILFESENLHHHGIARRKLIWIAMGIGLAIVIVFF